MKNLKGFNENFVPDNWESNTTRKMVNTDQKIKFRDLIKNNSSISEIESLLSSIDLSSNGRYYYCMAAEYGRVDVMKLVASLDRSYKDEAIKWTEFSYKFKKLSDDIKNNVMDFLK